MTISHTPSEKSIDRYLTNSGDKFPFINGQSIKYWTQFETFKAQARRPLMGSRISQHIAKRIIKSPI